MDRAAVCARCAAGRGCGAGLLGSTRQPAVIEARVSEGIALRTGDRVRLEFVAAEMLRGRAELEVRNIDGHAPWQRQFGTRIPVVEIGGRVICEYHLDREAVLDALTQRA